MNIVLATDNKYIQHCSVIMSSIMANNSNVSFFLFTEGLSEQNVSLLEKLVYENNCSLRVCTIDNSITKSFPMPVGAGDHISIATYYRLFVERIIPDDVDRVLYMDCDIVVRGDLNELWDQDISDFALGVVYQGTNLMRASDFERLQIPISRGYFNAGVLLINLAYWRSHDVTNRLFDFILRSYNSIKQHDQDVLNAVLYNEVTPISYKWNYLPQFLNKGKALTFPSHVDYSEEKEPVVIHFVSVPKPWEYGCKHPYTYEYYRYLDKTPFSGRRPTFKLKQYFDHVLKPRFIQSLLAIDFLRVRRFFRR